MQRKNYITQYMYYKKYIFYQSLEMREFQYFLLQCQPKLDMKIEIKMVFLFFGFSTLRNYNSRAFSCGILVCTAYYLEFCPFSFVPVGVVCCGFKTVRKKHIKRRNLQLRPTCNKASTTAYMQK